MIEVPTHFWSVSYNGDCFPGAPSALGFSNGANCQHFAYEMLRHYGKRIPNFRSSELWEDQVWTVVVSDFEPLDLLLYNSENKSWGAHIGVFISEGKIVHLSKELGFPTMWTHNQFVSQARYKFFLGGKRVCDRAATGPE